MLYTLKSSIVLFLLLTIFTLCNGCQTYTRILAPQECTSVAYNNWRVCSATAQTGYVNTYNAGRQVTVCNAGVRVTTVDFRCCN